MPSGRLVAVLTAAGTSSRMGRLKALVPWHGQPLIAHQVAQLAMCDEVLVVLGFEAETLRPYVPALANVRVLVNPDYATGRVSSLLTGFRAIAPPVGGILVAAVDQPLEAESLKALVAGGQGAEITVPSYQGRRGHPVLFRGDLLPELLAISENSEGLRAVTRSHERREVPVKNPDILLDLNRPEDWALVEHAMPSD